MDANSHEAGGIFDRACTAAPPLLKPVGEFWLASVNVQFAGSLGG